MARSMKKKLSGRKKTRSPRTPKRGASKGKSKSPPRSRSKSY